MLIATLTFAVLCGCNNTPGTKECSKKINGYFGKMEPEVTYNLVTGRDKIGLDAIVRETRTVLQNQIELQNDLTDHCFTEATAKLALLACQNGDDELLFAISSTHPANYLNLIEGRVEIGTNEIDGYRCLAPISVLGSFTNNYDKFKTLEAILTRHRELLYKLVLTTNSNSAFGLISNRNSLKFILSECKTKDIFKDLIELQIKYQLLNEPIDPPTQGEDRFVDLIFKEHANWDKSRAWKNYNRLSLLNDVKEQKGSHAYTIQFIFDSLDETKTEIRRFVICAAVATNNLLDLIFIFENRSSFKFNNNLFLSAMLFSMKNSNKLLGIFISWIDSKDIKLRYYLDLILCILDNNELSEYLNANIIDFFSNLTRNELSQYNNVMFSLKRKAEGMLPSKKKSKLSKKFGKKKKIEKEVDEFKFELVLKSVVVFKCALSSTEDSEYKTLAESKIQILRNLLESHEDKSIVMTKIFSD
eukprot:NODE_182_length_15748_cov_0.173174.p2 type:complete len:473 gc:universal NODE_182_length_15748_cov_0.173174:443-1861(+)